MNKIVVVIPIYRPYLTEQEEHSIRSVTKNLSGCDICFIGPRKLSKYIHNLSCRFKTKTFVKEFPNLFFSSIFWYNKLMLSWRFYEKFDSYTHILIAQLDTIVFGSLSDLHRFASLGFSYIGAPWLRAVSNNQQEYVFDGAGNGGLSLRNVQDHIALFKNPTRRKLDDKDINLICPSNGSFFKNAIKKLFVLLDIHRWLPIINEDKYICLILAKNSNFFKIAPVDVSYKFSFETHPSYLYKLNHSSLPFGCHAWEKNDKEFWICHIFKSVQ